MSWKASDPMSERVRFIGQLQGGERTVAGLCREFGISRKTAYKWKERFEHEGLDGLRERSRAPHRLVRQTPPKIQDLLIAARKAHSTWGPKKLKAWLEEKDPSLELPYPSTIGDLLKAEGLVKSRRRRQRQAVEEQVARLDADGPNVEWNADFKGEFRLGNGQYCYPLTISDAFSRYLLGVRALEGTAGAGARPFFERVFREYGLPQRLRTDNGSPFAGTGLGKLSALSVWWIRLGIQPVRGRPHHPQDNGRHERMHRTLKAETTRPPSSSNRGQQRLFDTFREEYNEERPHEALGQRPPGRLYRASPRPFPTKLPEVEYPAHYEQRTVCKGLFTWHSRSIFIGESLNDQRVGLVEIDDRLWRVYFGALELGVLGVDRKGRWNKRVLPMSPV